jgi:hypothetical protein
VGCDVPELYVKLEQCLLPIENLRNTPMNCQSWYILVILKPVEVEEASHRQCKLLKQGILFK